MQWARRICRCEKGGGEPTHTTHHAPRLQRPGAQDGVHGEHEHCTMLQSGQNDAEKDTAVPEDEQQTAKGAKVEGAKSKTAAHPLTLVPKSRAHPLTLVPKSPAHPLTLVPKSPAVQMGGTRGIEEKMEIEYSDEEIKAWCAGVLRQWMETHRPDEVIAARAGETETPAMDSGSPMSALPSLKRLRYAVEHCCAGGTRMLNAPPPAPAGVRRCSGPRKLLRISVLVCGQARCSARGVRPTSKVSSTPAAPR